MSTKKNKRVPAAKFEARYGNDSKFTRIHEDLLESEAFLSLTKSQKLLYIYMKRLYYNGSDKSHPNGDREQFYFNRALYRDKYKLYTNDESFRKDRDALIEKGFIICVEDGSNTRSKSIYKFSDMWQNYGTKFFQISPANKTLSMLHKERRENSKDSYKKYPCKMS